MTVMLFVIKNSLVKKKCEIVHCRDETASSFVAKVRGEVLGHFHGVAVNHYSRMWIRLSGLPG
jgi:hypothetical protein